MKRIEPKNEMVGGLCMQIRLNCFVQFGRAGNIWLQWGESLEVENKKIVMSERAE